MHTAINDPAILVVFELVAKYSSEDAEDDGTANDVGCGWGFISLFKRNVKSVDVSDNAASPATRYVVIVCRNILLLIYLSIYLSVCLKSRDWGDVSAETQQGRLTM